MMPAWASCHLKRRWQVCWVGAAPALVPALIAYSLGLRARTASECVDIRMTQDHLDVAVGHVEIL